MGGWVGMGSRGYRYGSETPTWAPPSFAGGFPPLPALDGPGFLSSAMSASSGDGFLSRCFLTVSVDATKRASPRGNDGTVALHRLTTPNRFRTEPCALGDESLGPASVRKRALRAQSRHGFLSRPSKSPSPETQPRAHRRRYPDPRTKALGCTSTLVAREAARALGNLAANLEHGDAILREGALKIFMALIRSEDHPVQRMAAMALCNLSSNVRSRRVG